jgi:hypothetical protein
MSCTVYRKGLGDGSWGSSIASLPGTATGYVDGNVSLGQVYEYQLIEPTSADVTASGYICSGIAVALPRQSRKVGAAGRRDLRDRSGRRA